MRWVEPLAVVFLLGGCGDDPLPESFAFRLDTQCEGSEPRTGVYGTGDEPGERCTNWPFSPQPCESTAGGQPSRDVWNPDVAGMAGGVEGDEWAWRVTLVGQEGRACVLSKSHRRDVCDREGVPCSAAMTPLE